MLDIEAISKQFIEWSKKKIRHHLDKIHNEQNKKIYFREKEVWWVAFGKNIGYEIDGKQELFERPALILKKYNENMCFVIPFTTRIKNPLPWFQVLADFGVEPSAAVISQGKTISVKRLLRKVSVLSDDSFNKIVESFKCQFDL